MKNMSKRCTHGRGKHLALMTKTGNGQSTGTHAMKASQAYPPFFCDCIRDLHKGKDIDWKNIPEQQHEQGPHHEREQHPGTTGPKRKMQSKDEVET